MNFVHLSYPFKSLIKCDFLMIMSREIALGLILLSGVSFSFWCLFFFDRWRWRHGQERILTSSSSPKEKKTTLLLRNIENVKQTTAIRFLNNMPKINIYKRGIKLLSGHWRNERTYLPINLSYPIKWRYVFDLWLPQLDS